MTFGAADPIMSGQPYKVHDVDGGPPITLDDFVCDRALTLEQGGLRYRIIGSGVKSSGTARFHQKDLGPDGKDIRVWTISNPADDTFIAEHAAAF